MLKKISKILLVIVLLIFGMVFLSNYIIEKSTKDLTFNSTENLPSKRVGIVLGTSKYRATSEVNLYYKYRLDAVYELFTKRKIEFILVSGDNSSEYYNEPYTFKKDLIKLGVPEEKIYLDYAGFRTLDSMVRAKEVFGLTEFIVISQKFHNQRAIFIAKQKGIDAIGFNAKNVSTQYGLKTNLREKLARVKVFIDFILMKQPKFLGEKIEIK
ncbi:vancomycin high temperature exclusion protein [Lutibacter sp. B1]|uniref:SanA/YdcF family protein n=1 Tax=Lutibacter sp. B1 TaxID=2725996 RepID=UPI001457597E|nr:ElyC/SanA/YdcF family protein [Lutibacter sp. B1]NLP58423.1 DUF218 domain-containing protein [Lutibacter sp. B1]